jgi:hypothetical protein
VPNSDIDFYSFVIGVTSMFSGSPRTDKAFGGASCRDHIPLGCHGFHYRFHRDRPAALNGWGNANGGEFAVNFRL